MLATVVSLYMVLTSLKNVPGPVAVTFIGIAFDFTFVILVVFKRVSLPYSASEEFLLKAKPFSMTVRNSWLRRYIRSCTEAKLKLGDDGYFDKLTSLVIWQLCVDNLITVLFL